MKPDDQTLLRRFYQDGSDDAFAAFIDRHRDWALAKSRNYAGDDAEDVVQVSILRMMDCIPVNGEVANPLGWWSTIIAGAAMDHLRQTIRRRKREEVSAQLEDRCTTSDPSTDVARSRLIEYIHEEISELDSDFRGPLFKRFFEDLSYREIADALNCSEGTVGSRLSRAIARIRANLISKGRLD